MSIFASIWNAIKRHVQEPMTKAEVDRALGELAGHRTEHLDWRHSIVDLLKLLNLDTSMEARKALAKEMNFPGTYQGTEKDNATLHKLVMDDVASRATDIPKK